MTAKTLLKKCRAEKRELLILAEKREALATSLLPKAMAIKEINVQMPHDADPMADRMAEAIDIDRELQRQMAEILERDLKAHKMVAQLRDSRHRQLLELYYLSWRTEPNGRKRLHTWETVAEAMGISPRMVYELIQPAMKNLRKVSPLH